MKQILFALIVVAGCGGSPKSETAAPPPEATPTGGDTYGGGATAATDPRCANVPKVTADEMEEQGLAAMDGLLAAFELNAKDCKAVADAVNGWVSNNRDFVLKAKCFGETATAEEQQRLEQSIGDKNQEVGGRVEPIAVKCQSDAAFIQAMQGMQELMQ